MFAYIGAKLANPGALAKMPSGILPKISAGERGTHLLARLPFMRPSWGDPQFEEADLALGRANLALTPEHRQYYLLGRSVEGESIAIDLDGTLLRFHNALTPKDKYTLSFQLKPGTEAWLLGLSQRNQLLLYTARDTDSLTHILNARPPMRSVFLPKILHRAATPKEVYRSSHIFSLTNWSDMMQTILDVVLDGGRALIGWEDFVLTRLAQYHRAPLLIAVQAMMHLKLPEMADSQGKIPFDIIVDDSNGLAELLALSQSFRSRPLRAIHLPHVPQSRRVEELNRPDDSILRAALALLKLTREPKISSVTIGDTEEIADNLVYGAQLTLPSAVQFRKDEIKRMEEKLKEWRNRA